MKHFLFISIFCTWAAIAAAQERNSLIVQFTSGERMAFSVSEKPQVTFDGPVMRISTHQFQLQNVSKYTFGDSLSTGISPAAQPAPARIRYAADGHTIHVTPAQKGQPVRIFSTDGRELSPVLHADHAGSYTIDLTRWKQQVLLLQVGQETIKIRRP
ncbi:MAG: hypothetical protein ILA34_03380 [Bacteroidaceae bacterium]|nr:hypothetical protein [Bacteroidaceae bacterium]